MILSSAERVGHPTEMKHQILLSCKLVVMPSVASKRAAEMGGQVQPSSFLQLGAPAGAGPPVHTPGSA